MKRFIVMLLILIACLILPGTIFHYWSWAGIKPDLAMLWVIYIALHHRPAQGIIHGFVIGLIVDFYLGRYIGLYAIILAVVALLISLLQQRWYRENIPLTMVLVFIVTVLGQTLMALIATTAGLNWYLGDAVKVILGISFYNCLMVPLTYPLVHKSFTEGILQPKKKIEQQL
jgi:rod shape-determining protein MreD